MTGGKFLLASFLAAAASAGTAFGAFEIPKASARALGVTRGKQFSSGVVFIDGKYMPPPYVVERWGNGIRINSKPVTGQVVPWTEFLKTQEGVKVTKTETPAPAAPPPAPAAPAASAADDIDDTSLDDLFDDDPKPKKKKKPVPSYSSQRAAPAAPRKTVTYSLDGDFAPNAASRALVSRINSVRTEIDRMLRNGSVICFGESYSRMVGDSRLALTLLEKLPSIMRQSDNLQEFRSSVRAAGLVFVNEALSEEFFRHKVDYPRLRERYEKLKRDAEISNMLKEVSKPLL